MAEKKKDIVINGKPYHCEIRRYEGGFEWTFYVESKLLGFRKKIIRLRFDRWWLAYLASDIKSILDEEQTELDRLKDVSGFK